MPALYEKMGLKFQYPENWKLTEPTDNDLPQQISLETPNGGWWSISLFPREHDSAAMIADAKKGLQAQYPEAEFADIKNEFAGLLKPDSPVDSDAAPSVEANFFCLDFLVTSTLHVVLTERYKMLIWFQAESREFEQLKDVFRAITISMLVPQVEA